MKKISNERFEDERSLFQGSNLIITNCEFDVGESPLKESKNIEVVNSTFLWKYPLWYSKKINMHDSTFSSGARAGVWYTSNSTFINIKSNAPKLFRKCKNITVKNVKFLDSSEMFWWNDGLLLEKIEDASNYFGMKSKRIVADNIIINGLYAFDGIKDSKITNSKIITKDAFWNSDNILIENSYIECEYFGWNSKNITLINCEIKSHQGFCYMDNIKLVNCKISGDLLFEYCTNIDADITNVDIESIKNPTSGKIILDKKCPLILDDTSLENIKIEYK